ncbi:hypothetical protein GCK32_008814 [Trichostrongylus colubriformis]|uniref:GPI transamidase component PIG-S n=1 Tax=Trichostrongylus colubriformis TaxID=6319 RepID=A0AAN8FYJ5_TRICO
MDWFGVCVGGSLLVGVVALASGYPHGVKSFTSLVEWLRTRPAEIKPGDENPPKNMSEIIERLPESFHKYMKEELPYRRAAALVFIAIVFGLGAPLWYQTTRTYRAPFVTFPDGQTISLSVQIHLATTNGSHESNLGSIAQMVLPLLREGEVKAPLRIQWNILIEGMKDLQSLEEDRQLSSDSLDVYIAVVSPEQWTHFSAINVFLSRGRWAFVQYTPEENKLVERLHALIWEVMVDVPHLNAIVKRDMRERMEPWQIAALSPSHQKRLVWDSAPLSMNYIVQVIHVHDNASPDTIRSDNVLDVIQISAGRQMADEALSHPSLLAMLYFPKDQTMAVYLPIMLPTLIPLFGSIIALCKWALGWS